MTSKPTVWVPNKNNNDFSQATKYGSLVYLTDGPVSRFAVDQLYKSIESKMQSSTQDDYILISGLSIMCCIATAIQVAKFRRANYLIHSPTDGYSVRSIEVD